MYQYIKIWVGLLCAVLSCATAGHLCAQSVENWQFVRVNDMAEIQSDSLYVIGAVLPADQCFYALSSVVKNKRCVARRLGSAAETEKSLTGVADAELWKIVRQSDGTCVLQSGSGNQYLYVNKPKQTSLALSATPQTKWKMSGSAGVFRFRNCSEPSRSIGLWSDTESFLFGNYANCDSQDLRIYKRDALRNAPQTVEWPEDGARVVLGNEQAVLGKNAASLAAEHYLLQDGTVAEDGNVEALTCVRQPDSCFFMTSASGAYLGEDLNLHETPALWKLVNGGISLSAVSNKIVAIDNGAFCMKNRKEVLRQEDKACLLVAAEVASEERSNGCLTLKGGWTADALACLGWEGIDELDMSSASVPVGLKSFEGRPSARNTIIYVNAEQSKIIPPSWPFVVKTSFGENELLTNTVLHDKCAFRCSRSFAVRKGRLSYHRKAYCDGNWETLFLPFAAPVPKGYQVAQLESVSGDELRFGNQKKIGSCVPLLIRSTDAPSEGTKDLNIVAEDCVVPANPPSVSSLGMAGVLDTLLVDSRQEHIYMLDASGQHFVLADAGSFLLPFRSYLKLGVAKKSYIVRFAGDPVTSLSQRPEAGKQNTKTYGLEGREYRGEKRQMLKRGIYIIGGKKIYCR